MPSPVQVGIMQPVKGQNRNKSRRVSVFPFGDTQRDMHLLRPRAPYIRVPGSQELRWNYTTGSPVSSVQTADGGTPRPPRSPGANSYTKSPLILALYPVGSVSLKNLSSTHPKNLFPYKMHELQPREGPRRFPLVLKCVHVGTRCASVQS